jgi:Septum formation
MRSAVAGVAFALVATLLSGCGGRPAGVDGDLTNGWAAMGKAIVPTPVAGACHNSWQDVVQVTDAVDCATRYHEAETAYVGTFTGADAQRLTVPVSGSPARVAAYAHCLTAAADYLGGDPHTAHVWLGLVLPSDAMWRGGARWYRCDLQGYTDFLDSAMVVNSSVRNGLRGSAPLRLNCLQDSGATKTASDYHQVGCGEPHDDEFAGVYTAPNTPFQSDDTARGKQEDQGCEAVVARYLGFTDGVIRSSRVGWLAWGFNEQRWQWGDRTEWCFAWVSTQSKRVAGSVKGVRAGPPKA